MSFRDIQIALDTKLNLLPGTTPIAWENTEYKPTLGTAWLRPTLLNSSSSLLDFQSHQEDPGIYRVDAFYPVDNGPRNLLDKLDAIYSHFKQSMSIQVASTIVNIRAMSILPRTYSEVSWLMGSIDINFTCYETQAGGINPPINDSNWILIQNNLTVIPGSLYIPTNNTTRVEFTLPVVSNVGDYFRIAGFGLAGWQINCPPGMFITEGDQHTILGGSLASTNARDCIELVCVVANQEWEVLSSQGNITVI